jgi:hypothetical protein
MNPLARRRVLLLLLLWLAAFGSAYAQQPPAAGDSQPSVSYTFVSPNTRENLTLAEAVRLLNSREERRLINSVHSLSRCLGLRPTVMKAIGSSTDGAEHAVLFSVNTDHPTLRYADARLGKLMRQKTVLNFRRDDEGAARMYVIRIWMGRKRTLASVSRTLDVNGVAFRTLVPAARQRMFIYVVDLSGELHNQVVRAARQLGGVMTILSGNGEFIGDDAGREQARQVFSEEVRKFEDGNPEVARRCSRQ